MLNIFFFFIGGVREFCTILNKSIDFFQGDSGGPLQIQNVYNPTMYTQFGVTSFGKFCGDKDAPGVYTRVSKYISWIEGIVWPKTAV